MVRYAPLILGVCLLAAGCQSRSEERAQLALERENERLTTQLQRTRDDNDRLRTELAASQAELSRVRAEAAATERAAVPVRRASSAAPSADLLPSLEPDRGQPAGGFVVVLASVGGTHADQERDRFATVAQQHEREFGSLPASFGVREPRSGGLQLVYGRTAGGFGISRAAADQALATLTGRYRDAYVLDIR